MQLYFLNFEKTNIDMAQNSTQISGIGKIRANNITGFHIK